jgi:hypothetical protein
VVGEHHTALPARRPEPQPDAFTARLKHRNAREGTPSELGRGQGLRHARYRGLAKAKPQHDFRGAARPVKRWIRLEAWKLRQALLAGRPEAASVAAARSQKGAGVPGRGAPGVTERHSRHPRLGFLRPGDSSFY